MASQPSKLKRVVLLIAVTLSGAACNEPTTPGGGDGGTPPGGGDLAVPPTGDGGLQACATRTAQGELAPLDILLALDTSYSMDFDGKWPAVEAALEAFAGDARFHGLGVGLQYFPLRATCDLPSYAQPAVPIATLPGVSTAFIDSLQAQRMFGGTPMVQVVEGVSMYLKDWLQANPSHKAAIVLATDGLPDQSCTSLPAGRLTNSLANVVMLATDNQAGTPSIPTFVIGVGSELTALNQIAQAGGTTQAMLVDTSADIAQEFLAALDSIRKRALACEYVIPPPQGVDPIDFTKVNVTFSDAQGDQTFVYVGSVASCSSAPGKGWYYDDANAPKKVLLCSDTCQNVQAAGTGTLNLVFGCKTIIG